MVEGHCCFTNYTRKNDSSIHYSCRRTSKDKDNDINNDIKNFLISYYDSNYTFNSVDCSGRVAKLYYNFVFFLIIFLIWNNSLKF